MKGRVALAARALFLITASIVVVFGFARVVAQPQWLSLYSYQFAFTPGDWFARKLSEAEVDSKNTCILIGASTVREGFDTALMSATLQNTKVVNLGTTGGKSAIDTVEIQAQILASHAFHYSCIVVGLHPMFLRKFEQGAFDVVTTDYAALLPVSGLLQLTAPKWDVGEKARVAFKYLMPLGQHSLILSRIARFLLFEAHRFAINQSTPIGDYELFPDELAPQSQYTYSGPSVLKDIQISYAKQIREIGWDNGELYGGREETESLHRSMRLLSNLTDRLLIVEMPESSLFNVVDEVARKPFEAALKESDVPTLVVRCLIPEGQQFENFHDAVHLNDVGRGRLSTSVAAFLSAFISGETAPKASGICGLRSDRT